MLDDERLFKVKKGKWTQVRQIDGSVKRVEVTETAGMWRSLAGFLEYWSTRRKAAETWFVRVYMRDGDREGRWIQSEEMKLALWLNQYDSAHGIPASPAQIEMF